MITRSFAWLLPAALVAAPAANQPLPDAKVTAVTLSHAGGTARLAIALDGQVKVRDFTLTDPARLVVDLEGASLAQVANAYDGLRRGIVRDVRVRQYEVNVVRIVMEFDRMPSYRVNGDTPGVVTVAYADEPFEAWNLGAGRPDEVASQPLPTPPAATRTLAMATATRGSAGAGSLLEAAAATTRRDPIDVRFTDATWPEVARIFSRYSGRAIIVGPGVTGTVNADLPNQTWENAFHAILTAYGYSVAELPGGILRIDSPGELAKLDSVEVLETRVLQLNYQKATSMAETYKSLLTKGRGTLQADSSLNALVITDSRTKLPGIVDVLKSLDIRTPTVSIAAKLVFVDRTDLEQLGFKYDLGTSEQFYNKLIQRTDPLTGQPYNPNQNIVNLGGNAMSAISNADAIISGSALDLAFTTAIGGFSLTAFLSALEQVQLTDVEARPIINTLDNHEAYILSGEETPVRVIDASSFGQANQAPRANVQFKETGIRMKVTPSVTANREIRMDIEVERSSIQPLAAADLGFTIPKQITKSSQLVRDGETSAIGGLTTTTVTRTRSGIPLLSSLPFVGNLFSFTTNNENRKDLIVMVTPRIVDDPIE